MIPRVLRNYNTFVNGFGYAGLIDEAELPEIAIKTEEHRGGGTDVPIELDMGMEVMQAKLTMAEYNPTLMGLIGTVARIQLRGALVRDNEAAVPMLVEMHGLFKKSTMGSWKAGDKATNELEVSLRYIKIQIAESVVTEIDSQNTVRIIGGVDQLASQRAAMGM
jgi:P2 family phage contractile tail tube protein